MTSEVKVSSMEELFDLVNSRGGVMTTTMEVLRDAYGKGRLGVHVREGIRNALVGLGLGHYPQTLPEYQERAVRLYRLGSPVGNLIEAVLDLSPEHDEHLRQAVGGDEAEILQQIRELVCP
jgi:hypothetical protein